MFCFGNAAPYFEGQIIENSREDYRAAVRFGDVRCGQKAIYFHHDGALYYLPYTCIDETTALVLNEHHSCCSGDSTMEVHKLLVKADGQDIYLEFVSGSDCQRAEDMIKRGQVEFVGGQGV